MITKCTIVNTKHKDILATFGYNIYLRCENISKEQSHQVEKVDKLDMDGKEGDETQTELVKSILFFIGKETPTQNVILELDLLPAIQIGHKGYLSHSTNKKHSNQTIEHLFS